MDDVIGQLLGALRGPFFYSDWFRRSGDSLLASWEVMAMSSSFDAVLQVETKNTEDTDAAAVQLASVTTAVPALTSVLAAGCKELVRYSFHIKGVSGDWVHVRVLPPSWLTN